MQGKATVAGHPVHPSSSHLSDRQLRRGGDRLHLYVTGGSSFWGTMSMWLVAFGIVGSLLAAFFGFVDYLSAPMSAPARRVANDLAHVHLVGSSERDVGTAQVAAHHA